MNFCPSCGSQVPTQNDAVCPNCGQKTLQPGDVLSAPLAGDALQPSPPEAAVQQMPPSDLSQIESLANADEFSAASQSNSETIDLFAKADTAADAAPVATADEFSAASQSSSETIDLFAEADTAADAAPVATADEFSATPQEQQWQAALQEQQWQAAPQEQQWQAAPQEQQWQNYQDPAAAGGYPAPPPINLPPAQKKGGGGRVVATLLIILLFVVIAGGTFFGIMYFTNRPSAVVDNFIEAIAEVDIATLESLTRLDGTTATESEWAAFCAAFEEQASRDALASQLLAQAETPLTAQTPYAAVSIENRSSLLFIQRYTIVIEGVDLLATGAQDGSVIQLGTTEITGRSTDEGMLYSGLMPGLYSLRIAAPGADISAATPITIEMFATASPNRLQSETLLAEITIENCIGENATLFVNNTPIPQQPQNSIVIIPDVALGSVIHIVTNQQGDVMEASVTFADPSQTALRFENYIITQTAAVPESESGSSTTTDVAAEVTAEIAESIVAPFYISYLNAINEQNIDLLRGATDAAIPHFAERISRDGNVANMFEYVGVVCDEESIETTETSAGEPVVKFVVTCSYRYTPRNETNWQTASNQQAVELIYRGGVWLVDIMDIVAE